MYAGARYNSSDFFCLLFFVLRARAHTHAYTHNDNDSFGDYVHHSCFRHTSHGRFLGISIRVFSFLPSHSLPPHPITVAPTPFAHATRKTYVVVILSGQIYNRYRRRAVPSEQIVATYDGDPTRFRQRHGVESSRERERKSEK